MGIACSKKASEEVFGKDRSASSTVNPNNKYIVLVMDSIEQFSLGGLRAWHAIRATVEYHVALLSTAHESGGW